MTVVGLPRRAPQPSLQTSRSRRAAWLAMTLLALLVAATSAPYLSGDPGTFLDLQRETYLALLTPLMLHVGGAASPSAAGR